MSLPLIPETAPFTPQQRAWLNGFFAGAFGATATMPGAPATVSRQQSAVALAEPPAEEEEPWHDPALPMEERLSLTTGKPLASRLMSAMAQLDCGACGYLCKTYSAAIACGEEKDLTRCSPGGSETLKMLRKLTAEVPAAPSVARASQPVQPGLGRPGYERDEVTYSRANPFIARVVSVERLTHLDAPKDTRHVAINLLDSGLTYEPGDAVGVCPVNCPDLVQGVLDQLGSGGDELVAIDGGGERPLRLALAENVTLARTPPALLELLAASATDPTEATQLKELLEQEGGPLAGADVCEILERFPSARPEVTSIVASLARLQPRLYSISSSLRRHPGQVHATVGVVRFESAGRWRNGVASHFLGVRSNPGDPVRVFIQPSHRFRLPADPSTPIIMVGPGTGIAPFLSFLQEREATGAAGKNWLLFGNQYISMDFLYRDQLNAWADGGLLTRLDLAFSRDTAQKVYVQDRMREQGRELWDWLQLGAHFYVCGDARRMAPDVDAALLQIAAQHGGLSCEDAKKYVTQLVKESRYLKDVY